jgi:hypothetical protein
MTDIRKWPDDLLCRVPMVSLLNEPIDYSVVEVVVEPETARQRADRVWKMEKEVDNGLN